MGKSTCDDGAATVALIATKQDKIKRCDGTDAQAGDKFVQCDELTTALALKADLVGGKVPASQLPSYVDDVLEFTNLAAFPAAGETGKIYTDLATNKIYRWSGSTYIEVSAGSVQDPYATPAQTIAGTSTTTIVNPAGLAAAIPVPVLITGSVVGVGVSFAPAGTYSNQAVAQTLTGATTTLTNTTSRPQLVTFTLNNEAIWYAPFVGGVAIYYRMIINGVEFSFSGLSRLPPNSHNDIDNRHMTGVINHVLAANSSATFALKETMQEANGLTAVVPANTLLSYGGFVTYVQHSV